MKIFKKRAMAVIITAVMLVSLTACGSKKVDESLDISTEKYTEQGSKANSGTIAAKAEVENTETPTPTPEPTPTPIASKDKLITAIKDTLAAGSYVDTLTGGDNWVNAYSKANKANLVVDLITTNKEQTGGLSLGLGLTLGKDTEANKSAFSLNASLNGERNVLLNSEVVNNKLKINIPNLLEETLVIDGNTLEADLESDSYIASLIRESAETDGVTKDIDVSALKDAITGIKELQSLNKVKEMYDNLLNTVEVTEEADKTSTIYSVVFTDDAMVDFGVAVNELLNEYVSNVVTAAGQVEEEIDAESFEEDLVKIVTSIEKLNIQVKVANTGLVENVLFELDVADSDNYLRMDISLGAGERPLDEVSIDSVVVTNSTEYTYEYNSEMNCYDDIETNFKLTETSNVKWNCGKKSDTSAYYELAVKSSEERQYENGETSTEETSNLSFVGSVDAKEPGQIYTITARVKDYSELAENPDFEYRIIVNLTEVETVGLNPVEYDIMKLTEAEFMGILTKVAMNVQEDLFLSMILGLNSGVTPNYETLE